MRIVFRHLLRNSLIPIITLLGLSLPVTISGAVITECGVQLPRDGAAVLDIRDNP